MSCFDNINDYPRSLMQKAWHDFQLKDIDAFLDVLNKHASDLRTRTIYVLAGGFGFNTNDSCAREDGLRPMSYTEVLENGDIVYHRGYMSIHTFHDSDGWNTNVHIVYGKHSNTQLGISKHDAPRDTVHEVRFSVIGPALLSTKKSLHHAFEIRDDDWLVGHSSFIAGYIGISNMHVGI